MTPKAPPHVRHTGLGGRFNPPAPSDPEDTENLGPKDEATRLAELGRQLAVTVPESDPDETPRLATSTRR